MNKKHALIFVTITVFLDTVGFGIIVPVIPQYLADVADVNLSEASALSATWWSVMQSPTFSSHPLSLIHI